MVRIKYYIPIFFILLLTLCIIVLDKNFTRLNNEDNMIVEDMYFVRWNSYHGYYANEQPFIQLPLVYISDKKASLDTMNYNKFILISSIGDINVTQTSFNLGPQSEEYDLYTLGLFLPSLNPGTYEINALKIIDKDNNEKIYNIGDWLIEVKEGNLPNDLIIGKSILMTTNFLHYTVELTNDSANDIIIKDLLFKLKNKKYNVLFETGENYNMSGSTSKDLTLNSKGKKAYRFTFEDMSKEEISGCEFISIKPFLLYDKDDEEYVTSLPTAIYSPIVNDESIMKIVEDAKMNIKTN